MIKSFHPPRSHTRSPAAKKIISLRYTLFEVLYKVHWPPKKSPDFFFSGWYWASHSIGHLPDDEGIIRAKLQSGTLSRITIWDQQLEGQHTYICLGLGRLQISFSSPLRSDCECISYCRSKQYLKRNLRTVIARESPYLKSTWWSSKC